MLDPEINLYADTSKGEPAYIPKPVSAIPLSLQLAHQFDKI